MIELQQILSGENGLSVRAKINALFRDIIEGKEGVNAIQDRLRSFSADINSLSGITNERLEELREQVLKSFDYTDISVADLLVYINGMNGGVSGFAIDTSFNPEFSSEKPVTVLAGQKGIYTHFLDQSGNPITITQEGVTIFYRGTNSTYWKYKTIPVEVNVQSELLNAITSLESIGAISWSDYLPIVRDGKAYLSRISALPKAFRENTMPGNVIEDDSIEFDKLSSGVREFLDRKAGIFYFDGTVKNVEITKGKPSIPEMTAAAKVDALSVVFDIEQGKFLLQMGQPYKDPAVYYSEWTAAPGYFSNSYYTPGNLFLHRKEGLLYTWAGSSAPLKKLGTLTLFEDHMQKLGVLTPTLGVDHKANSAQIHIDKLLPDGSKGTETAIISAVGTKAGLMLPKHVEKINENATAIETLKSTKQAALSPGLGLSLSESGEIKIVASDSNLGSQLAENESLRSVMVGSLVWNDEGTGLVLKDRSGQKIAEVLDVMKSVEVVKSVVYNNTKYTPDKDGGISLNHTYNIGGNFEPEIDIKYQATYYKYPFEFIAGKLPLEAVKVGDVLVTDSLNLKLPNITFIVKEATGDFVFGIASDSIYPTNITINSDIVVIYRYYVTAVDYKRFKQDTKRSLRRNALASSTSPRRVIVGKLPKMGDVVTRNYYLHSPSCYQKYFLGERGIKVNLTTPALVAWFNNEHYEDTSFVIDGVGFVEAFFSPDSNKSLQFDGVTINVTSTQVTITKAKGVTVSVSERPLIAIMTVTHRIYPISLGIPQVVRYNKQFGWEGFPLTLNFVISKLPPVTIQEVESLFINKPDYQRKPDTSPIEIQFRSRAKRVASDGTFKRDHFWSYTKRFSYVCRVRRTRGRLRRRFGTETGYDSSTRRNVGASDWTYFFVLPPKVMGRWYIRQLR